jgi:hypothetical protein
MTALQGAGVPVGVRTRLDDTVYATKVYAYEPVISSSLGLPDRAQMLVHHLQSSQHDASSPLELRRRMTENSYRPD